MPSCTDPRVEARPPWWRARLSVWGLTTWMIAGHVSFAAFAQSHPLHLLDPRPRGRSRSDEAEGVPPSVFDEARRGPWPARRRSGVRVLDDGFERAAPSLHSGALDARALYRLGLRGGPRTRIAPERWPREPVQPRAIDPVAFQAALTTLCPERTPPEVLARIGRGTLEAAHTWNVDPFLLASLAYQMSRCQPNLRDSYGVGLTRIHLGMHHAHIRDGRYHYGVPLPEGGFAHDSLSLEGRSFSQRALLEPGNNLFFAALLLRVFEVQCPKIDAPFGSARHRHAISHLFFGDMVRSPLPEAMVLTARRRLLAYYAQHAARACSGCGEPSAHNPISSARWQRASYAIPANVPFDGRALASPLDGAPRIVIGILGDAREHGGRIHAGIDLLANEGEPVRAMRAGSVISAGVDLGERGLIDLPPEHAVRVPVERMGARGLFVRVLHDDGLVSLYAHLASYDVQLGDRVEQGQRLGEVGRTGVRSSGPHLHLGLFDHERVVDPLVALAPYVLFEEAPDVQPVSSERKPRQPKGL